MSPSAAKEPISGHHSVKMSGRVPRRDRREQFGGARRRRAGDVGLGDVDAGMGLVELSHHCVQQLERRPRPHRPPRQVDHRRSRRRAHRSSGAPARGAERDGADDGHGGERHRKTPIPAQEARASAARATRCVAFLSFLVLHSLAPYCVRGNLPPYGSLDCGCLLAGGPLPLSLRPRRDEHP